MTDGLRPLGRSTPLADAGPTLVEVAMGRMPADRVIRGGRVVNVHTREVIETDVAIAAGRIAFLGDVSGAIGSETVVTTLSGEYLVPGLIDTHAHIESTLVTVGPFADAALAAGTTTALIENHDMANVFGAAGIRWMIGEARQQRMKLILSVPACVPPMRSLEDSAATIEPADIRALLDDPLVGGLGEMMNMAGVMDGDPRMLEMIGDTLRRGLIATGHWSLSGWNDHRLQAYAATGVDSCHESTNTEDALAKLRAGMWVQFREGSAFHDMAALAPLLRDGEVDPRHILFVTDDVDPDFLEREGHLDNAVRVAIRNGIDPLLAIQCATVGPAEYLGRRHDLGSIAPGRCADILIVPDLTEFRPVAVIADGEDFADPRSVPDASFYPPAARESVLLSAQLSESDLAIPVLDSRPLEVRVIGLVDREVPTEHRILTLTPSGGEIVASIEEDVLKLVLVTRTGPPLQITRGLLQGLGLRRGAIAQSTARDTHHLLAIGSDDGDMLLAIREVERMGGGIALADGGEIVARLALPIAGLMSDRPIGEVADQFRTLTAALAERGCAIEHPTTMLALLAVSAIPELRIGNRGLIDAREFRLVDVVVDQSRAGSSPAA